MAEGELRFRTLDVYYMNVAPEKSSSSKRRRHMQDVVNPATAARHGWQLVPRRVEAVTPDSREWLEAQSDFGELPMRGTGAENGAAASCILLSFRAALRCAVGDSKSTGGGGFVLVAEDDMVLLPGFSPILDRAMWELVKDPEAMGGALHSESLAQNGLESRLCRVFCEPWPRYPGNMRQRGDRKAWPGFPVIPDQPVALLLKVQRLPELLELYEQRLEDEHWSPLDWLLANAPFGDSGTLRLASHNGFCHCSAAAPGTLSTGSDRTEQHHVAEECGPVPEANAVEDPPRPIPRPTWPRNVPVHPQAPVEWHPPSRRPAIGPVPDGAKPGRRWLVVAGERSGGLVVRSGRTLASFAYKERLQAGAWVEELERDGDRLHYKRLWGDGPDWGWVSFHMKGRQLLTLGMEPDAVF